MGQPRGIRNANPGNIRRTKERWRGLRGEQTDPAFFQFIAPLWGLRAAAVILRNYQRRYGLKTTRQIIGRWAPPSENVTDVYVTAVAKTLAVGADQPIDLDDRSIMFTLVSAIVQHENGQQPYTADLIHQALTAAGLPDVKG